MFVRDENWPEIHISSPWDPYYCLVRHYGVVYNFFMFWKISSSDSKPIFCSRRKCRKIHISSPCGPHSVVVRHFDVVHKFIWIFKHIEFVSKSKCVSLRFYWKHLFRTKISQKSAFHLREAHILAQLDITVLYPIFWGFKKYQVSAQNPNGLAFSFIDKCLFTAKTSQKYVFHPCEAHIIVWLDITVFYINF
jgi:hypothetical protein